MVAAILPDHPESGGAPIQGSSWSRDKVLAQEGWQAMMNALQALGTWRVVAIALAFVAVVVLLPLWRVRRRRRLAVRREVRRLQRDLAIRDALESQQD